MFNYRECCVRHLPEPHRRISTATGTREANESLDLFRRRPLPKKSRSSNCFPSPSRLLTVTHLVPPQRNAPPPPRYSSRCLRLRCNSFAHPSARPTRPSRRAPSGQQQQLERPCSRSSRNKLVRPGSKPTLPNKFCRLTVLLTAPELVVSARSCLALVCVFFAALLVSSSTLDDVCSLQNVPLETMETRRVSPNAASRCTLRLAPLRRVQTPSEIRRGWFLTRIFLHYSSTLPTVR